MGRRGAQVWGWLAYNRWNSTPVEEVLNRMPILEAEELNLHRCPHCSIAKPRLGRVWISDQSKVPIWVLYVCSSCESYTLAYANQLNQAILEWFPSPKEPLDESIPELARDYLNQAQESLHAPDGAVMLCASSVDAMLKAKGLEKGTLNERIIEAKNDGLMTEGMEQWAHHVRLDSNKPRHADTKEPLSTPEEAKQTLEFTLALAEFLYVLPSRVAHGLKEAASSVKEGE